MKKKLGILFSLLSALVFGFTPILGKLSFDGGSNGVMLAFLRALFVLPVLYTLLKNLKIPMKLSQAEFKDLLLVGTIGAAATPLLLYSSYEYIPVGLATVIHFFYPLVVSVAGILLFKENLVLLKHSPSF